MKLWKGRFQKEADPKTNDFNSSISIDSRMYKEDIEGSIAHATMLGAAGIIDKGESEKICAELEKIEKDIETGALHIDPDAEDIHTFIEGELTARIGDAGKRLHTARSRNDQVALDVRLTLRKECAGLMEQLKELINVLCDQAEEYADTVTVGKINVDEQPQLAAAFGVESIPTLIAFKNGVPLGALVGLQTKESVIDLITG